ncbi:MAG TPA: hypothetical protein DEB39_11845 [Planctomycetaceae bacterium]|nr:hypothetical protein [Planctomycetaceae bacterium]
MNGRTERKTEPASVYSTKNYDRAFFEAANEDFGHEIIFFEARLDLHSSKLAEAFPAVCTFVSDDLNDEVLQKLHEGGNIPGLPDWSMVQPK